MIILTINYIKAIAGEGAFVNGQQLMPPNELKLQDAIISFGTQYINDDTSKALYDASFSVKYWFMWFRFSKSD